jgi:DNA polymerase III subunit epsilon
MVDFVAIDFETANEKRDSACAIGVTVIQDGIITDSFSRLIRPKELRFSERNTAIHGISVKSVESARTLDEIWPEILPVIDNQFVFAHNAPFDMSVLRHSLASVAIPVPPLSYFCSCKLARCVWPKLFSHTLSFLAPSFGIKLQHHEPESDSRACAEIVLKAMLEIGAETLSEIFEERNLQPGKLNSATEWTPDSAPAWHRSREYSDVELKADFDPTTHEFYGKNILITGTLIGFASKDEAFGVIKQLGGKPMKNFAQTIDYLICGEQDLTRLANGQKESTKLRETKKLVESGHNVRIISESDFIELLVATRKDM